MATLYWTGGANNGTWTDANNWNPNRDGSGVAAAPAGGDTLFIEQTNQTINGLDTGHQYASVTISFGGNIGSSASPVRFTATGTVTIRTTAGTHYLAATSAGTIVKVHVAQTGTGKVYLAGPGAITTLSVGGNAQWELAANCAVTTLETAGGSGLALANGTAFTTANLYGGSVESYRGVTTATIAPLATLKTQGNAAAITTAIVLGKHINWSSSTVANSNVGPQGEATAKGSPYACTVTDRKTFEGGKNYIDSPNVTFTNSAVPIGQA